MLALAWLLWAAFPPFSVLVLPDNCVGNKVAAFLVALVLMFFPLLSWAYVGTLILNCQAR